MALELANPRDVAVLALRDRAGNVSSHASRLLERAGLSPPDAALARELALGVERRLATVEAVLRAFLAQPHRRLPGALNEILHVALYQLLFLDRVPAFAAVNEAVEQASRFHHRRQSGMVNGVLRSVQRALSPVESGEVPAAADVVPVGPRTYRKVARAVFPDPAGDAAGHLAAAWSLPPLLAGRWTARHGPAKARELAAHADARAPLVLRVNRLAATVEQALAELADAAAPARAHANGVSVVLDEPCNVAELAPFRRGAVQPQDASATAVVLAAAPRPGASVLDLCAAPGTKTTHLAELMDNRGAIVAADVSADKLARVSDNCRRMGVTIVRAVPAGELGSQQPEGFDLVLVDAPCSNSGVLARRPEARWRITADSLASLAGDQFALLRLGGGFCRRGGRLVYSTCSIEPEECQNVARRMLQANSRLRLLAEQAIDPQGAADPTRWYDGGYYAIFEKQ